MELENILTDEVDVFDITENEDFPFAKTWKTTYETIEASLNDYGDEKEKERILKKISHIVNVLVRFGNTYEDIVLETAELYVFAKEAGLDSTMFENVYGKHVSKGVQILCQDAENEQRLKDIFENREIRYLAKIQVAEYLVDFVLKKSSSKKFIEEVDYVLNNYGKRVHKNLMDMLIAERAKRK